MLPAAATSWRILSTLRWMDRRDVLDVAHPALADPAIGHHELDPPRPGEFE
jgi:hypothetical protein